ncbi:MAG: hypothetical protein ACTSPL_05915 [Candidatus Odinarchaeia archaeon]
MCVYTISCNIPYLKLDFRIPIFAAILLLIFCAITLSLGYSNIANQTAIIAYYSLSVGVVGLFISYLRGVKD